MSDWNELNFKATKHYISIRKGTKNLAYLNFRKDKIILHIYHKVNFSGNVDTSPIMFELDDPRKLFDMYRDSEEGVSPRKTTCCEQITLGNGCCD